MRKPSRKWYSSWYIITISWWCPPLVAYLLSKTTHIRSFTRTRKICRKKEWERNYDESISHARIISDLSRHTHSIVTFFFGITVYNSEASKGNHMCSVCICCKTPKKTRGDTLSFTTVLVITTAISHGYLTQPHPSSSSFHTPLGITGCWSERLRETPSSLEILRFIPWTEQHQDVANAANASILRLSDDCAKHIRHGESKKTFPQSGYDRQNFKKERQQKAL